LAPLIVHESTSAKHIEPSPVGLAFSWYDVGHIQLVRSGSGTPGGPARPPTQKLVSLTQRYWSGERDVLSHSTPRSDASNTTPEALQPLVYMLPAGGGASQCACVSKHWNSLPCGSAPGGTCSATHAHVLLGLDASHTEPNASAMPLPHHVLSNAQRAPSALHGFSASASQLSCNP
jgi:hypothetical protein